ncbi:hypothetical protein IEQ34_018175 [Dendrobium chrysotoxum]|uniref:Uncharacterized protein n=1 Tax=Dendrobium chrysotoxum TaxID=161865 RepID=A0AAV7GBN2_DENCH|nr:hypothetical protein IEQ34_018175 [Dendrobium chrysotoxum]
MIQPNDQKGWRKSSEFANKSCIGHAGLSILSSICAFRLALSEHPLCTINSSCVTTPAATASSCNASDPPTTATNAPAACSAALSVAFPVIALTKSATAPSTPTTASLPPSTLHNNSTVASARSKSPLSTQYISPILLTTASAAPAITALPLFSFAKQRENNPRIPALTARESPFSTSATSPSITPSAAPTASRASAVRIPSTNAAAPIRASAELSNLIIPASIATLSGLAATIALSLSVTPTAANASMAPTAKSRSAPNAISAIAERV